MSRRKFIAGNWKMNTTLPEAVQLAKKVVTLCNSIDTVDIALCVPYISLVSVYDVIKNSRIKLGAQDLHWEKSGAFTGKISAEMLVSCGVTYVIIGHSEQRTYFYETNETVCRKMKAALFSDLLPIVCVGETLAERKSGQMERIVLEQIRGAFKDIDAKDVLKCTIAYEPVWAIGTGEVATSQQANDAHVFIRREIASLYSQQVADSLRIQYGGSLKPENAKELLSLSDVDGGLIGGASLKAENFFGIVAPT